MTIIEKEEITNGEIIPVVPLSNLETVDIVHPDPKQEEVSIKPCGGPLGQILSDFRKFIKDKISKHSNTFFNFLIILAVTLIGVYIGFMINNFINTGSHIDWCYGYGKAFITIAAILWCIAYYKGLKPFFHPNFKSLTKSAYYVKNIKNLNLSCGAPPNLQIPLVSNPYNPKSFVKSSMLLTLLHIKSSIMTLMFLMYQIWPNPDICPYIINFITIPSLLFLILLPIQFLITL